MWRDRRRAGAIVVKLDFTSRGVRRLCASEPTRARSIAFRFERASGVAARANFLDRGEAGEHLLDAVLAERAHALLHGQPLQLLGAGAVLDQAAQLARDDHELVDAGAP